MAKTKTENYTFFDTDLQIHRLSPDPALRKAAQTEFKSSRPSAMSAFSLVELKGNYIQCLILLRRKVATSNSFEEAYARINNSGGRRSNLMFAQLIRWLGGVEFPIKPWEQARRVLLTHLDAQIEAVWERFQRSVDLVVDDFSCSRASEAPQDEGGKWTATIPKCRQDNTNCRIANFIRQYNKQLKQLLLALDNLDPKLKTNELFKIKSVAKRTIDNNKFPWEGITCRQVGDLLIGLQSKLGRELLSSNYKEHSQMHKPLGYVFREFPLAKIRSK